jgi:hypothetical protein
MIFMVNDQVSSVSSFKHGSPTPSQNFKGVLMVARTWFPDVSCRFSLEPTHTMMPGCHSNLHGRRSMESDDVMGKAQQRVKVGEASD